MKEEDSEYASLLSCFIEKIHLHPEQFKQGLVKYGDFDGGFNDYIAGETEELWDELVGGPCGN